MGLTVARAQRGWRAINGNRWLVVLRPLRALWVLGPGQGMGHRGSRGGGQKVEV